MANVIVAGYSGGTGMVGVIEIALNEMGHDAVTLHLPDETAESLKAAFAHPAFPKEIGLIIAEANAHGDAGVADLRAAAGRHGDVPVLAYSVSGGEPTREKLTAEGAAEVLLPPAVGLLERRDVCAAILKYVPAVPGKEWSGETYTFSPDHGLRLLP